MRLLIELDEKYKNLFYEVAKAADATIFEQEPECWMDYPEHVMNGVEKSLHQAKNGQTKTFEQVKRILANR